MPMVISGYVAVPASALQRHGGHELTVPAEPGDYALGVRIWCSTCATEVAREYITPARLPCGCLTRAEHDEGVAIQERLRQPRDGRACIGCLVGDDGPSVHSCAIHPRRDWPA